MISCMKLSMPSPYPYSSFKKADLWETHGQCLERRLLGYMDSQGIPDSLARDWVSQIQRQSRDANEAFHYLRDLMSAYWEDQVVVSQGARCPPGEVQFRLCVWFLGDPDSPDSVYRIKSLCRQPLILRRSMWPQAQED